MLWKLHLNLKPKLSYSLCIKLIWDSLQFLVISRQVRPTLARITPSAPSYWNLCISWCQSVPIKIKRKLEKKPCYSVISVYGVYICLSRRQKQLHWYIGIMEYWSFLKPEYKLPGEKNRQIQNWECDDTSSLKETTARGRPWDLCVDKVLPQCKTAIGHNKQM